MTREQHHNAVNEALGFPLREEFEKEICELMAAEEQAVVIAIFDMDKFLRVNTEYGFEIGDQVLIDTGKYFKENLPENATIYRISGDEFGVIFKEAEKEEVFLLLEGLRKEFPVKVGSEEPMSVTIGIASFDDAGRYQELFRKAEGAMLRAKHKGGNKIALAKEEKMVPKTSHYTQDQLNELSKLAKREGVGEAVLLREALDMLIKKYDV